MPKVEVPFVDGAEVDTSDPSGSLMNILMLVVGSGIFFMVLNYGQNLGGWLTGLTDGVLGTNASGSNGDVIFGGGD